MKKIITRITAVIMAAVIMLVTFQLRALDAKAAVTPGQAYAWGVDVSVYQRDINWAQVKAAGCSFAIIRGYTSKSGVDKYFVQNVMGANAVGIKTGVYVYSYATSVEAAVAEANALIAIMEPLSISFPVCIDVEDKVQKGLSPDALAAIIIAFSQTIENAGYQPMVYSSKSWFTSRISPIPVDKWVAQWNSACDYAEVPCIWQQTSDGSVPGIAGRVDVDYIYKDYSYIIPQGMSAYNGVTYLYNNYRKQRGWVDMGGNRYYCNPVNAAVMTGWIELGGYYFNMGVDGAMLRGLQDIDGARYFFGEDGVMRTGLQTLGEDQFLFAADGKMHTGWFNSGAGVFYFDPTTGAMHKGWLQGDGKTYCFTNEGIMITGLATIGEDRYLFNPAGEMQVGIQIVGNDRFYFDPQTGKNQRGLIAVNGSYYYFNPDTAAMQLGLVTMADGCRYFDPATGAMVTGWVTIAGNRYFFDPSTGLMAKGVMMDGKGIVYLDPEDGHQCVGIITVGGVPFYIEPKTGYITPNVTVEFEGHIYMTDGNGVAILVQ